MRMTGLKLLTGMTTLEERIGEGWYKKLEGEFQKDYMKKLSTFVLEERKKHIIHPAPNDVFKAYRLTPFKDARVVIVGQDPYPHKHANGLAFSTSDERKTPASLKNILREVYYDTGQANMDPNLERWAKQGVFLINRVLTVRHGEPFSHAKQGWEQFTLKTIERLCSSWSPRVFILWGKTAQSLESIIPKHNCVIKSVHPSPLSANNGFFGSKPFSRANEFLSENNYKTINW